MNDLKWSVVDCLHLIYENVLKHLANYFRLCSKRDLFMGFVS